jgi:predicted extracellular nuclease
MEDPMRLLRERGWKDAFTVAKVAQPYSYLYNGMLGRLDHALLSPALAKRLRGAAEWHSNADEPDGEGYAGSDTEGPWRSSDHDPMVLGFDL